MATIGIDYREANRPHLAGKGQYVKFVTEALIRTTGPDIKWVLFVDDVEWTKTPDLPNVERVKFEAGWKYNLQLNKYLKKYPVDLFFSTTSFVTPALLVGPPVVQVVMDLVSWRFPLAHNKKAVLLEQLFGLITMHRVKAILAISESTKRDLISVLNANPDKITITPLAAGMDLKSYKREDGMEEPYLLYVGTLETRKNLVRLIKAYDLACSRRQMPSLVLAGKPMWGYRKIKRARRESPNADRIIITGPISENRKITLMKEAVALVFPSTYEGFGMPPLEAMELGTPVITSNVSSLPEVVGDAALLVDPLSIKELSDAMMEISANESLRTKLSAEGRQQASKFSWQRTAKLTWSVFEKII